jgi:hypothetical protein
MHQIATLQSVQVGTPRRYEDQGAGEAAERSWETSFVRVPSPERRWLARTHLHGNAQADTKNHGKPSPRFATTCLTHVCTRPWQRLPLPAPHL